MSRITNIVAALLLTTSLMSECKPQPLTKRIGQTIAKHRTLATVAAVATITTAFLATERGRNLVQHLRQQLSTWWQGAPKPIGQLMLGDTVTQKFSFDTDSGNGKLLINGHEVLLTRYHRDMRVQAAGPLGNNDRFKGVQPYLVGNQEGNLTVGVLFARDRETFRTIYSTNEKSHIVDVDPRDVYVITSHDIIIDENGIISLYEKSVQ